MESYINKFIQKINEKGYLSEGSRNNNLIAIARYAKFYELDQTDYENFVKNNWGSNFTKNDETSMRNAWEKARCDRTYSQFLDKNGKLDCLGIALHEIANEQNSKESQTKLEQENKFYSYLSQLDYTIQIKSNAEKCLEQPTDSSFLLKIFDQNDLVWMSGDLSAQNHDAIKDILVFSNEKAPLKFTNFFCINPLKDNESRTDENVKAYRYLLIESDELKKTDQLNMLYDMIQHGVPIKMITFTGNKSCHALVKVNGIKTADEWNEAVSEIFARLNTFAKIVDEKCKNPSRLSRMPFAIRQIDETETRQQTLLYLQEDDSKLKNGLDSILNWFNDIVGEEPEEENEKQTFREDELMYYVDQNKILDIWMNTESICTKERAFVGDDIVVKKWAPTAFWNMISTQWKDRFGVAPALKDLKELEIRYKEEHIIPFIGEGGTYDKDTVNLFSPGWLGKALADDTIPSTLNKPLEQLLDNIFGDDIDTRKWTLQWMQKFMHTFKVMTAPVFWEIPGTGKSMLTKCFGEAIGNWMVAPLSKEEHFNSWQQKTVVIFEESQTGSKRDGRDLGYMLKEYITSESLTIERKGQDAVQMYVPHCCLFNSNINDGVSPVFIEDIDRRYTIIRNDNAENLINIWTTKDYDKWNSGELKMRLMKYIYTLEEDPSVNVNIALDNKWKREVQANCKSNLEAAVEALIEECMLAEVTFMSNQDILFKLKNSYGLNNVCMMVVGKMLTKKGAVAIHSGNRGYSFENLLDR